MRFLSFQSNKYTLLMFNSIENHGKFRNYENGIQLFIISVVKVNILF